MRILNNNRARHFIYGVELLVIYILQSTPSLLPEIFGESPMLVTMCAVSIALFEGNAAGMWFGLGAGLLMDVAGTGFFGFYGLVLLILCYCCGTLVMYVMRNNLVTALCMGFFSAAIVTTAQWIFLSGSFGLDTALFFLGRVLLPRSLYSVATMPLFFYFNRAIFIRVYDE